ncbi:MAG: type II toxin-antitoxin system HicA family toxin [Gemmatimonadaceae bacterium]
MKTRDVLKLLHANGWRIARIRGSHHHFKHPEKRGIVTVPVKKGADVPPGTLRSILRQAGLTP